MKKKTGLEELEQFTLTRGEYAKSIGKTPNAVRMMMRHGKLSGEFRFDGNKYLFKDQERPRESNDNDRPKSMKMTAPKVKKVNRGNHFKADYPNEAFRLYNENKKRLATLNKIEGKFKSKSHEIEFNKINDEALKVSLKNTQKKLENSFTPLKDYGGPIGMRPRDRSLVIDEPIREPVAVKRYSYYEIGEPTDPGSVEIDLSRSRSNDEEPKFKNKVAESIWRLKNKK